jgi:3-hydroxyacyl-[acyl-carrier-protein] dehydratase
MTDTIAVSAIPHRPPFLFVDEVVELADKRIVTSKLADPEAEFFRGHYPGDPIMPGVLICECCFQAGALLIAHLRGGLDPSSGTPVLTRIQDARFKRVVRPGDSLRIEVTIDDVLDDAYFMTGRVTVDGKAVVRVTFACTQVRAEATP